MPRKLNNGRLWTAQQAAQYLGIGKDCVRKLMLERVICTITPYPNNQRELRTTQEWCDNWIHSASAEDFTQAKQSVSEQSTHPRTTSSTKNQRFQHQGQFL